MKLKEYIIQESLKDDVLKHIKDLGYETKISKNSSKVIIIPVEKSSGSSRKQVLMHVLDSLKEHDVPAEFVISSRLKSTAKSSVGGIQIDDLVVIAKPVINGGSLGAIDARMFSSLGKKEVLNLPDEDVLCTVFDNSRQIEQSILKGIENVTMLGEPVKDIFEGFFNTGNLDWEGVDKSIVNKLGNYIGELLIGWALLANKKEYIKGSNPFKGKVNKFYLPDDPSFTGIDSFVRMDNGVLVPISSKFDIGASASFFANVLPRAIKVSSKRSLPNGTLRDLVNITQKHNIKKPAQNARKIVYLWGTNEFLGLRISKPWDIVADIRKGSEMSSEKFQAVHDKVITIMKKNNDPRLKKMPYSLSSFFNHHLAKALNKEHDLIKELLLAKDFYQANLKKSEWLAGSLEFSIVKAGEGDVRVVGDKSPQSDITQKQGWVNYQLKMK